MTLKVAHVVRQYLPSRGGMEEVVRNIVARQQAVVGHEPKIITLDRLFRQADEWGQLAAEDVIEGVPVRRLPFRGSGRYPLCPSVLRNLEGANVVHVHGVDFFHDYLALTRFLHRRPLVLSTHGGFFHTTFARRLKKAWFHTITRVTSRAYARVVATSENDGEQFRRILPPSRVEVIENGVDTGKYANSGSATPVRTLIYFGRWASNKRLSETLGLLRALRAHDERWRLIIAGREYDLTTADLLAEAAALGVDEAVEILPGPTDTVLRDRIAAASYFVCLSRHEGFGLAAIEAMSAGLTPVLSDIPPFRQLIDRAGLGVIDQAYAAEELARKLLVIHEIDTKSYERRRERAMAVAHEYAWSRIADRYLKIYETEGVWP